MLTFLKRDQTTVLYTPYYTSTSALFFASTRAFSLFASNIFYARSAFHPTRL